MSCNIYPKERQIKYQQYQKSIKINLKEITMLMTKLMVIINRGCTTRCIDNHADSFLYEESFDFDKLRRGLWDKILKNDSNNTIY